MEAMLKKYNMGEGSYYAVLCLLVEYCIKEHDVVP